MTKRKKDPTLEVYTIPCPHPQCARVFEISGQLRGVGLCACHAAKIDVTWQGIEPLVKLTEAVTF